MIIRALAISVACLALGTPAGRAAPLEPERASDTVTLYADSLTSATCAEPGVVGGAFAFDLQINMRGIITGSGSGPFTIPSGKVLVVTSFAWLSEGSPLLANQARTARLIRRLLPANFDVPSAMSTALADAQGRAGGSETFPTGLVVEHPARLCMQVYASAGKDDRSIGVVNGYLAPDK